MLRFLTSTNLLVVWKGKTIRKNVSFQYQETEKDIELIEWKKPSAQGIKWWYAGVSYPCICVFQTKKKVVIIPSNKRKSFKTLF